MVVIMKSKNIDFFNHTCYEAQKRFKELPEPIEWIEPSINMLYLNAVSSYVFGNYFSSIMTMGILLEHVLRLVIFDKENNWLKRDVSIEKLDSLGTITKLIEKAKIEDFIENEDINWWEEVAKVLRNKSAHYILPFILKEFSKEEYSEDQSVRESYHPEYYRFTSKDGVASNYLMHDWGAFFHKSDYFISKTFIVDATKQIKKIILKTSWLPDRSWWKSQENQYNMFFDFNWEYESMKESLERLFKK